MSQLKIYTNKVWIFYYFWICGAETSGKIDYTNLNLSQNNKAVSLKGTLIIKKLKYLTCKSPSWLSYNFETTTSLSFFSPSWNKNTV